MKKPRPPEPAVDGTPAGESRPGPARPTSQPRLVVSELELPDGRYELAYSRPVKP